MGGGSFTFKRFVVEQRDVSMKVGTDGVLLGAWCRVFSSDEVILDAGTGSGIIALQLAQRTEGSGALIEAVEIDGPSARQAERNFATSPWSERIVLHGMSLQEFAASSPAGRIDHIVSNPPYFVNSLASPEQAKNVARHTGTLSYEELIEAAHRLLRPEGRLSLILPAGGEAQKMIAVAAARRFGVVRLTEVHSTPTSGPKRTLIEFWRNEAAVQCPETSSLIIQDDGRTGNFSAEYRAMTRDFYLYF